MKTVRDVMTSNVDCCTPLDNVYEVAVKMKELDVGAIPIVDNESNTLLGMITDRDLVIRGYAEKRSGSNQVTNVMSEDVITVPPNTSLKEASGIMAEHQIRRLPVVDNGQLVGIVSLGDLAVEKMSNESAGYALTEISESEQVHH
ncbi:CBS domain-containing protein [Litchfieldia alkalitelluris]|uniref:CBS domain-containing protein n=1 Tax=Litchfieldia alkalitelluris TaxID=304268 RepID=UPI000996D1DE|nr:CBS domain-containing protein [Litchfieldia alkalitelluris]